MPLVCRDCAKPIKGSVADHYRTCHFSTYAANGDLVFREHPKVFLVEAHSTVAAEVRIKEAKKQQARIASKAAPKAKRDHQYLERQRRVAALINCGCDNQTYRGGDFVCDICLESKHAGRRLLTHTERYSVCYSCYKAMKEANPGKRGNKHVFINTPM